MVTRTKAIYTHFMRNAVIYNRDGCEGYLRIDYGESTKPMYDVKSIMIDIGLKTAINGMGNNEVIPYLKYVLRIARANPNKQILFVVPDNHYFQRHIELMRATLTAIRSGFIRDSDLAHMAPIIVTHTVLDKDADARLSTFMEYVNEYMHVFPRIFLGFAMRLNPIEYHELRRIECVREPTKCVEKFLRYNDVFRRVMGNANWDWFLLGINRRVLTQLAYVYQSRIYGDTDNGGRAPNTLVRKLINDYARKLGIPIRGKGLYKTAFLDRCLVFHVWKYNELPNELSMGMGNIMKYLH